MSKKEDLLKSKILCEKLLKEQPVNVFMKKKLDAINNELEELKKNTKVEFKKITKEDIEKQKTGTHSGKSNKSNTTQYL